MERITIAEQERIAAKNLERRSNYPKSRTVADVLERYKGVGPGFDFLRLILATLIFYGHTALIQGRVSSLATAHGMDAAAGRALLSLSYGGMVQQMLAIVKTRAYVVLVPMFFALSGFLVAGSALRTKNVITFLRFRLLRIFPALCVEVVLSAFLLGPIFTTVSFEEYFFNREFFRYFGNIVGHITYNLPGVFIGNPQSGIVNGALWTLPAEFFCYLIMSAIIVIGILWRRQILLFIVLSVGLFFVPASLFFGVAVTKTFFSIPSIVCYFLAGVTAFCYRDRIPIKNIFVFISVIGIIICIPFSSTSFILIPLITYITIWIGLQPRLALPFMRGRDYSYGIYLYNFPITQALFSIFPGISRFDLIVAGLGITTTFAALSWHYVEKPFLSFKR